MENADMKPQDFWDQRYAESARTWSGNVNSAVADVVTTLDPGTALDLGCGEGADVLWLAKHGWQATGVDISPIAVQRAEQAAEDQGLSPDQVRFIAADLASWNTSEMFQLVTASFLQSPVEFDRADALLAAQQLVAPGGHLLVTSHATFPPWAKAHPEEEHDHEPKHEATTPESELALLGLDPAEWTVQLADLRSREMTGPQGQQATLDDTIILARRS